MYMRSRMKRWLFISFIISFFIYVGFQIHHYRMAIVDGWGVSTSRDINEYILPNISSLVIRPDNLCESPAFLLVIVCSAPFHFEERNAVRESWGFERNISEAVVKVYFLLGQTMDGSVQQQIETESDQFKDIIQENFIDTYNNLTLKSVLLLKLVKNECRKMYNYVMKTDDDMFVNMVSLVKSLLSRNTTTHVLFGRLICGAQPIRDFYEKWYVPEYMYPGTMYPNYLSGTAYVMSADTAEILFETALRTPLIHLEDVYLTGICAKIANIKPRHQEGFYFKRILFDPCTYKTLITCHYINPTQMRQIHFRVVSTDLVEACKAHKESRRNETTVVNKLKKSTKKVRNVCL